MKQHRENLLKLIKMMETIKEESFTSNKAREMLDSEAERYIQYERLISVRELTRMFIEELNSEYLQCSEGDEIVRFVEDMMEWLQLAYDYTVEYNSGSTGVKSLKVCSQSLSDYKKVYEDAKKRRAVKVKGQSYATLEDAGVFEFGKRNLPRVEINNTGMTLNEGSLTIVTNTEKILNSDTECVKKLDEIYEWIKNQNEILLKLYREDLADKTLEEYQNEPIID